MDISKRIDITRSPQRNLIHRKRYKEKLLVDPNNEAAKVMLENIDFEEQRKLDLENDPEWRKDNLEYDLRTNEYMVNKVRTDIVYAQHLYAALCNNDYQKNDVWPILQDKRWSCSWRYAGGILANMCGEGDYMDWYCSGITSSTDITDEEFAQMSKENQESYLTSKRFVNEGVISSEILEDLFNLGWKPVGDNNEF